MQRNSSTFFAKDFFSWPQRNAQIAFRLVQVFKCINISIPGAIKKVLSKQNSSWLKNCNSQVFNTIVAPYYSPELNWTFKLRGRRFEIRSAWQMVLDTLKEHDLPSLTRPTYCLWPHRYRWLYRSSNSAHVLPIPPAVIVLKRGPLDLM